MPCGPAWRPCDSQSASDMKKPANRGGTLVRTGSRAALLRLPTVTGDAGTFGSYLRAAKPGDSPSPPHALFSDRRGGIVPKELPPATQKKRYCGPCYRHIPGPSVRGENPEKRSFPSGSCNPSPVHHSSCTLHACNGSAWVPSGSRSEQRRSAALQVTAHGRVALCLSPATLFWGRAKYTMTMTTATRVCAYALSGGRD